MNMTRILLYLCLLCAGTSSAQHVFPDFLEGTWKIKGREAYEEWTRKGPSALEGKSYELKNGQQKVSEYLSLTQQGNNILYTATVLQQNSGKPVDFILIRSDSVFVFENKTHDFPKQLIYRSISPTEMQVNVTDGGLKGFTLIMNKVTPAAKEASAHQ